MNGWLEVLRAFATTLFYGSSALTGVVLTEEGFSLPGRLVLILALVELGIASLLVREWINEVEEAS